MQPANEPAENGSSKADLVKTNLDGDDQTMPDIAMREYGMSMKVAKLTKANVIQLVPTWMALRRVETTLLVAEMGRGFRAMADERQGRLDEIIKVVEPTPEQEVKIQAIVCEGGELASLNPSQEKRADKLRRVIEILTPEQRRKLFKANR